MIWRQRLSIKLFIGFWVVSTAVLASWMLTASYFDSRPGGLERHDRAGPPPRYLLRLMYQLQNVSREGLAPLIAQQAHEHRVQIYLLDQRNQDLLGRAVPERMLAALQRLEKGPRRMTARAAGGRLVLQPIYREDLGLLHALLYLQPPRYPLLHLLGEQLWLRLLLAVLVSGLLCYLLARVMTRRLQRVEQAAQALAAGDLDARVPGAFEGGDETGNLARSFNTMAEQLQRRINTQKELLHDVSHELRSPLARLQVALALAQRAPQESETQLARIGREAERLEALITQLLETQRPAPELKEQVNLADLLHTLCEDVGLEASEQDKVIDLTGISRPALVKADRELLRRALDNILRNAVQHTPPGTKVNVSLTRQDDSFLIVIEDAGPGVPEASLPRLFEPFYRVDSARARASGGYGLGLAIAQRGILAHGGTVRAQNGDPGLHIMVSLPATGTA